MLPSWEEIYQNDPTPPVALKKSHLPQESGCPLVLTPTSLLVLSLTSPQGQQGCPESSHTHTHTHTHTLCFLIFSSVCLIWGLLGNREQWITKLSFRLFAWLAISIWGEGSLLCRGNLCVHGHLLPLPPHSSLKLQKQRAVYRRGWEPCCRL